MSLFGRFFSKEKKKEAELLYKLKKLVLRSPNDIVSRRTIGDLCLKNNKNTEALEQFVYIAAHYRREEFYSKAIAIYRRIVKIDPDNESYHFELADTYVKNNMKTEAASIYRRYIEKAKREKNTDTLIELLNKVIAFDKNNLILRIEKANELIRKGDTEQAVDEYLFITKNLFATEKLAEIEKLLTNTGIEDDRLFCKLLLCYIMQNKITDGLELIKKYKLGNSKNIELLGAIIDLYLKQDSIKSALKISKKVFNKEPEATDIFLKIVVYYLLSEKYDEAYDYLLPIINENVSLKNYNSCIEILDVFINYTDGFIPVYKKISSIYKKKKDRPALIKHYERLIPVYRKKELNKELKKVLEELVEISETPFTYRQQLAEISNEQVIFTADEEINEEEEFLAYNNRLLSNYLIESDFVNAVKISNKIIEKHPDLIEPRVNLIEVIEKSGDLKKALNTSKDVISFLIKKDNISDSKVNKVETKIKQEKKNKSINLEDTALDFNISDIDVEELIIDLSDENEENEEIWEEKKESDEFSELNESFYRQKTFDNVTSRKSDMEKLLVEISNSLGEQLKENKQSCKSVCLKITNTDSKMKTKTLTNDGNIFDSSEILECSKNLLKEIDLGKEKFKSLSISVSKLEKIAG